jgi:DNA primase
MKGLGYTEEELIAAFLCGKSQKTGRAFDMFRNRVIFPVIDTAGNIVAFGGRVMDDSKPKYLNSSDTPGFKKSRILFGLNYAKNNCAEQMILCEGYMDTIAMHAAGFENAVATLGTAITPEHARLLARYTKRVIINYDSDEAGQRAANKAMALLDEVGLEVRVLKLTGAKDADEYIRTYGADAFRSVIENSHTAFDFKLRNVLGRYDLTAADGKIRAAREVTSIIAATASGVERELYIQTSAKQLGISADSLSNDVKRARAKRFREMKKQESKAAQMEARSFGDRVNPDAAKDPAAAAAEEAALGLLMVYPEHRKAVTAGRVVLTAEDFFTDLGKRTFERVMESEKSDNGYSFSALGEFFDPDEMGRLVRICQDRQSLSNNDESVLCAAAEALRLRREQREAKSAGDWQSEIERRRAALQKKKQ